MGVSTIAAIIHGSLLPIFVGLFDRIIDEFAHLFLEISETSAIIPAEVPNAIAGTTFIYVIVSFVAFFISFTQRFCALIPTASIGNTLRNRFFQCLIA